MLASAAGRLCMYDRLTDLHDTCLIVVWIFQATRLLCHLWPTEGLALWQRHTERHSRQWPLSHCIINAYLNPFSAFLRSMFEYSMFISFLNNLCEYSSSELCEFEETHLLLNWFKSFLRCATLVWYFSLIVFIWLTCRLHLCWFCLTSWQCWL